MKGCCSATRKSALRASARTMFRLSIARNRRNDLRALASSSTWRLRCLPASAWRRASSSCLEKMDSSVRDPQDVLPRFGLPLLGAIPEVIGRSVVGSDNRQEVGGLRGLSVVDDEPELPDRTWCAKVDHADLFAAEGGQEQLVALPSDRARRDGQVGHRRRRRRA